jgi:hypothetical protein
MNYRKTLAVILILLMSLAGTLSAFSAAATLPADVAGGKYEQSVNALIEQGIVTGYPDGTYRPLTTVSRAEMCTLVVKSMKPSAEDLADAATLSKFPDLAGYEWAASYINLAAANGVVRGYPDGSFRPAGEVTYNEAATMVVSAAGFKAAELAGSWPGNVIKQAETLGMMDDFEWTGAGFALRGDIAMMLYPVLERIASANQPAPGDQPAPGEQPASGDPAGKLADYSSRAYGVITGLSQVSDKKGNAVLQLGFLLGKNNLYVNAKPCLAYTNAQVTAHYQKGDLFGLQMLNGTVQIIGSSDDKFLAIGLPAGFDDYGLTDWAKVTARTAETLTVKFGGNTYTKAIIDGASVYKAVVEGGVVTAYETANLSEATIDSQVRLYTVTGKVPGVVEVVLIK